MLREMQRRAPEQEALQGSVPTAAHEERVGPEASDGAQEFTAGVPLAEGVRVRSVRFGGCGR